MALAHTDEAQVSFTRAVRGFDLFKIGKIAFESDEGFIKAFSPDIPATRFVLAHLLSDSRESVIVTDPDASIHGLLFDGVYTSVVIKKVRLGDDRMFHSDVTYDEAARQTVLNVAFKFNEIATAYLQ